MSAKSSAAITVPAVRSGDKALDTPEFIKRLAEDQRLKSGSDLPLSCFIEQVKMQLKGRSSVDPGRTVGDRVAKQVVGFRPHTSEFYKSWAMPE
ncbi:MAG: hypothetical protein ABWY49_04135 [Rhizobium sp.]